MSAMALVLPPTAATLSSNSACSVSWSLEVRRRLSLEGSASTSASCGSTPSPYVSCSQSRSGSRRGSTKDQLSNFRCQQTSGSVSSTGTESRPDAGKPRRLSCPWPSPLPARGVSAAGPALEGRHSGVLRTGCAPASKGQEMCNPDLLQSAWDTSSCYPSDEFWSTPLLDDLSVEQLPGHVKERSYEESDIGSTSTPNSVREMGQGWEGAVELRVLEGVWRDRRRPAGERRLGELGLGGQRDCLLPAAHEQWGGGGENEEAKEWIIHDSWHDSPCMRGVESPVPVYVMLPLDTVTTDNVVSRPKALKASLVALKSAGIEGVMMDVWWGIVEGEGPQSYNWSAYKELVAMVEDAGLKLQVVMSFHQCGSNVGDHCFIPLPKWVVSEFAENPDLVYTDKSGKRNYEYLSLGCDLIPVLQGRTPIQAYTDFMRSFRDTFRSQMGRVITEVQVGLGPAGELRYPAYPEARPDGNGKWRFPGIGEFQCYDKFMLASLSAAAASAGRPHWGYGGPHDAGTYNQWPEETGFFRREGSWNSPYGRFFLQWYSEMLVAHGDRVLGAAAGIFRGTGVHCAGKVAGIHWHYLTRSHAAELTAGYYNTCFRDGYAPLARMFGRHGATLNFTCIEMRDAEQPFHAACSPEGLLRQIVAAAVAYGVRLSGENALPRFDEAAHEQVVTKSRLMLDGVQAEEPMSSFTFLRMSERLFRPENWRNFVLFVRNMKEGRTFNSWERDHHHTHINMTTGHVQQVAAAELMCHK